MKNKILFAVLTIFSILLLIACSGNANTYSSKVDIDENRTSIETNLNDAADNKIIDENGSYTSKEEVALYIYTYKKLPKNFITKNEAKKLGWVAAQNNLDKVAKGKSIGGDKFSNYEKILPVVSGRTYYECDIDFNGKKRNAKRIVYADDFDEEIGFIFYTDDHYKTFEKLY